MKKALMLLIGVAVVATVLLGVGRKAGFASGECECPCHQEHG